MSGSLHPTVHSGGAGRGSHFPSKGTAPMEVPVTAVEPPSWSMEGDQQQLGLYLVNLGLLSKQ